MSRNWVSSGSISKSSGPVWLTVSWEVVTRISSLSLSLSLSLYIYIYSRISPRDSPSRLASGFEGNLNEMATS